MKFTILALTAVLVTSCGKKTTETIREPAIIPTPVSSNEQLDIDAIVAEENEYRVDLGQTMLSKGLSCTLFTTTGGDRIYASIAGHNTLAGLVQVASFTYKGNFNQQPSDANEGLNVLPAALRMTYLNGYLLRCQGYIVIIDSNFHEFELNSDDASVLYLEGVKTIDNDNAHGPTIVAGFKYIRKGVRAFKLDYAQTGAGQQALVLNMDGELLNSSLFFH